MHRTGGTGQKVGLKQAVQGITKNKELLAFIGPLLTFNLCTQIVWGFAVYYFKVVYGNEYLYSVFGGTKLAEMLGLVCFPMIAGKITREKTYTLKSAQAAAGLFTGIGLQMVGYNAKLETQSAFTVNGLRALMVALPIFMAVCSYLIYTKCYTLKGKKMDEVTEQMNQLRRAQSNGN